MPPSITLEVHMDKKQEVEKLFSSIERQIKNFVKEAKDERAANGVLSEETKQTAHSLKAMVGNLRKTKH